MICYIKQGFFSPIWAAPMPRTTITLSSKNYSSWSLRGWLMAKFAGIEFDESIVAPDNADARAEILLLSPSILVPCLTYEGHQGLGHARDRRVPQRGCPQSGLAAQRSGKAGALPLDLRRDALGFRFAAPGAADEHQGAFSRSSRSGRRPMPTSSASRSSGANVSTPMAARSCSARFDGGCDVCPGRQPLPHL